MALSKPFFASLLMFSLLLHAVLADVLMADSNNNVGRTLLQNMADSNNNVGRTLLQNMADSNNNVGRTLLQNIDCVGACDARCAKASRPKICKRACGTCCQRCNCVPPGTSGNKDVCPCYANMTTYGGKPKCP